jgi:hypothetical protein
MLDITVLVIAKAPVPGLAKTRLAAGLPAAGWSAEQAAEVAAELAAAALLDTLHTVAAAPVAHRVVALSGGLDGAHHADEIRRLLGRFTVVPQRGDSFGERLANAHRDAGDGRPVVQIGMDTPQVGAAQLADCARALADADAVLGPAADGGWWVLGVTDPAMADCLRTVPMSQPNTGELTLAALRHQGLQVRSAEMLADFDTVADVDTVRRACRPDSRFARAAARLLPVGQDDVVDQQRADHVDGQRPPL